MAFPVQQVPPTPTGFPSLESNRAGAVGARSGNELAKEIADGHANALSARRMHDLTSERRLRSAHAPFVGTLAVLFVTQAAPAMPRPRASRRSRCVLVSSRASLPPRSFRTNTYPSQNVFSSGNHFHVARIDATAVSAQVVDHHIGRDWGHKRFVREPVRGSGSHLPFDFSVRVVHAVAAGIATGRPFPARIGYRYPRNVFKKPLGKLHASLRERVGVTAEVRNTITAEGGAQ